MKLVGEGGDDYVFVCLRVNDVSMTSFRTSRGFLEAASRQKKFGDNS